jgi:biopolymer transport protein ExbB/TolQ
MPELDQLSEIIGTLRAEVKENRRQHDASFKKLDIIDEKITKLTGAVEMLAAEHARLKKRVDHDIDPVISDYNALKNKGLGVIAFVGLMGTGIGAGIIKFFYGN